MDRPLEVDAHFLALFGKPLDDWPLTNSAALDLLSPGALIEPLSTPFMNRNWAFDLAGIQPVGRTITPTVALNNRRPHQGGLSSLMQLDPTLCACGCGFPRPPFIHLHERNGRLDSLWAGILCDLATGCWMWQRGTTVGGYGVVSAGRPNGGMLGVHRRVWELTNGPIPKGLVLMHLCDTLRRPGDLSYRRCCRPDHLKLGTNAENTAHMMATGRNGQSSKKKLRLADALEIRQLFTRGMSYTELAHKYHVSQRQVGNIVRGFSFQPTVTP